MPTIQSILDAERNKPDGKLMLFSEGLFLKAYEMSAFLLWQRYHFKPSVRFVKCVRQWVVSVGFPESSLSKFLPDAKWDANHVVADSRQQATALQLEQWKQSLQTANSLPHYGDACVPTPFDDPQSVLSALRSFEVEKSTPMDCMNFLMALKKRL